LVRWHDRNGGAVAVALAVVLSVLLVPAAGLSFRGRFQTPIRPDHCSLVLAGFLIACERLVEFCGDLRVGSRLLHAHPAHAAVNLLVRGRVSEVRVHLWVALMNFGDGGGVDGRRWRSGSRPLPCTWCSPHPLCTWSRLICATSSCLASSSCSSLCARER
jgi:hypothetical protein